MRIAHLSDIHIRLKDRHDEYEEVFARLYEKLRKANPNRILLTGDIVHSKITLSPELVSLAVKFLRSLATIAPVDVITGNHDMNMSNMDRMDALTPIIDAAQDTENNYDISYYTRTGLNEISDNVVYGVYSLLDGGDIHLTKRDPDKVYIALYHGPVAGCVMDGEYVFSNSARSMTTFDGFDYVMLGDIHKRQTLREDGTAAYCGSLIQQNYGEDIEKGFLLWDITDRREFTCEFIQVPNDYAYATINADDYILPDVTFPPKTRIRVIWPMKAKDISKAEAMRLNGLIRDKYNPLSIQLTFKPIGDGTSSVEVSKSSNLADPEVQRDLLVQWFNNLGESVDIDELIEIDKHVNETVLTTEHESFTNTNWNLKSISMDNFMSYDTEMSINFDEMRGVIGLFGNNTAGKSVVIDAILYALFNKTTRDVKNEDLVNKITSRDTCNVKLQMDISGVDYEINRWTTRQYKKSGECTGSKTDVTLKRFYAADGKWEDLTGEQRNETEKVIRNAIGSFDDFMITTLSTQGGSSEFLKLKRAPRSDVMLRFLGLEVFAKKYDYAKDLLKGVESTMKSLKSGEIEQLAVRKTELEKVESEIRTVHKRMESLDEEITKIRGDITTHTGMINNTIKIDKDADALKVELDSILEFIKKIELEKATHQTAIDELAARLADLEKTYALDEEKMVELAETKRTADKLKDRIRDAQADINSAKRVLKVYRTDLDNEPKCPVSDDRRHETCSFLSGYVTKKKECVRVIDDVSKLQQDLETLSSELSGIEGVYGILDEQSRIREHITKGVAKLSELKRKVSDCDNKLEVKEVSTNLVRSQLKIAESNEETIKRNRDHREAVKTLNSEISKHTAARSSLDSSLSQLDRRAGILTKEISTIEDIVEKLRQCDKRHRLLSLYCSAMHRTGLQVDILRNHLPRINYEINRILSDVVNFQVFLNIEEGETDIDIVMQYGDNDTRPAQMASGMEKLLINMAIRYALLTVSNLNTSSSWFIDEGFGVLDAENMSAMSQFFDNVRSVFRNIIIITHIDTLKDVSDWAIGIERRNEISVANSPVKNI